MGRRYKEVKKSKLFLSPYNEEKCGCGVRVRTLKTSLRVITIRNRTTVIWEIKIVFLYNACNDIKNPLNFFSHGFLISDQLIRLFSGLSQLLSSAAYIVLHPPSLLVMGRADILRARTLNFGLWAGTEPNYTNCNYDCLSTLWVICMARLKSLYYR